MPDPDASIRYLEALIFGTPVGWAFIVAYFVPTVVSFGRKHPSTFFILMLNLLLGWTGLGWLGALAWAISPFPYEDEDDLDPNTGAAPH